MFQRLDPPAAGVDVANDGADEILRHRHFDSHHRLQKHRAGLANGFLECHGTGNFVRHFVGIDIMVAAVVEAHRHIDHREARQNARIERLANALVDRLDELLGDGAALDVVDEFVALPGSLGLMRILQCP